MIGHLPSGIGASNIAVSRYYDAANSIDGIALVGGSTSAGDTNLAFYLKLSDHSWGWLANYPYSVSAAAAARAGDTLYVHGGWCSPNVKDSTFKYAEMIYSWNATNMNSLTPRTSHGLVYLYNRYLYAVGGTNNIGQTTSSVERLDPQGGPPIYVQAMPQSRTCAVTVTAMGSDAKPHIYVLGGKDSLNNILNSIVEYDSGTGWTTKGTSMPVPRWQAAGAVVNGLIYLIGGVIDGSNTITRRVDIYNPVTNTWVLGDSIPVKLFRAGACGVNNTIYLFGGSDPTVSQSDSVWQYRPFAPNPPQLVLPPPNAYVNNQLVNFVWRSVPDAGRYRIQVSTDPNFYTIDILDHQTATNIDTVISGVTISPAGDFYWRVKSYNPSLSDSSLWSPVRRLTLDLTPPDQPVPSTPDDGTYTNNPSVYFSWFAVDGVDKYHLQIAWDQTFAAVLIDDPGITATGTTMNLSSYGEGTYYWRVEARDTAGNHSGYHSIPSFILDMTSPYVTYTDPSISAASVAVDQPIVIGFSEPIGNSFGYGIFNFTCSPDPGGWSNSWNAAGDTVTLYHFPFPGGQNITFTLTDATDLAVNNLASNHQFNFTTAVEDLTPPTIEPPITNAAWLYAGTGSEFRVRVTDDVKVAQVIVYWGPVDGTSAPGGMVLGPTSNDEYAVSIGGTQIYKQGVRYQVVATDSAGNSCTWPSMGDYYIHPVRFNEDFQTTLVHDQWQMISIPSDATNQNIFHMLADELDVYNAAKWRLFVWFNGIYNELNTPDNYLSTIHKMGQAFWVRDRVSENYIKFEAPDSSIGGIVQSEGLTLTLDPGWNDIGNPFMFPIDWMNVYIPLAVSGPYHYNPNQVRWWLPDEVTSSMLFQPFKGFSFKNDNSYSVDLTIYPYAAGSKPAASAPAKSPGQWQALVRVEGLEGADHNYFGINPESSDRSDRFDYPEPPSGLTGTSGYFRLADDKFCTDVRPEIGEGQVWNFAVECNGSTELAINLPVDFPSGTECYLADLTRQVSVKVAGDKAYSFIPESGEQTREFRIIVGSSEYAKQVLGSTFSVPTATVLGQNLPNPFSGQTTISYQLAAEGKVRISVYNVAGQLVRTLLDEHQMTGRYSVAWDGKDQAGRKAAAGLYFYQMQTPDRTLTRRMALIR
jgi:hypothetical protein